MSSRTRIPTASSLVTAIVASTLVLGAPVAADPPDGDAVRVLVAETADVTLGDLHWRDGTVYAVRDPRVGGVPTTIAEYPDTGTATAPVRTTAIPDAWTTDGQAFNGSDAFEVGPDGQLYVRAPRNLGRYTPSSASGWGVARLQPDGSTVPASPASYPGEYAGELGGTSSSLVMEPDGSGLLLGGSRQVTYTVGGTSYGVVARLPLPLPADQQAGAELVVSGSGFHPDDSSSRFDPPFLAATNVRASVDPYLDGVLAVDAKGPYLYVNESGWDIHRVDRRTDRIVSICCRFWSGWDPPAPVEGDLATETHFEIAAGPVADRAGNVFFAHQAEDGLEIWEIRGTDGTIHHVAGGGTEAPATGVAPLDLRLRDVGDVELDPDGNLYLTAEDEILELREVAAADTAPGAPRDLVATPGVGTLDLAWDEPADDGGQAVTGYTVRVHPVGVSGDAQDVVRTVTTLTTAVTGLTPGAGYEVSVAAVNGRGAGPAATTTAAAAAYHASLTATPATVAAGAVVQLDASASLVPAGSTFEFFCDVRFREPAAASGRTATCRYPRGSNDEGYGATVVVTAPGGAPTWHATQQVQVSDPPNTVEGSAAFAAESPDLEVAVAGDGSLAYDSVQLGARIVLTAAPGTFRPGSRVRIHRGDAAELQAELGSDVAVQGGFAVTWVDAGGRKYDLVQPLVVTITPQVVARQAARRAAVWDIGATFQQWGQSFVSGVASVVGTIGSALEFVGSKLSELWALAAQSLTQPNSSRTNDVVTCSSFLVITGANSYRCEGVLTTIQGVATDRIAAIDAGARVVSAGGANVVSAGGANVVSAGGANVVSAGGANVRVTLAANSVISAGGANVVSAGGANVVSAGGANVVSAGGANVVSAGGANVISAGGANLTGGRIASMMALTRDPGFAFAEPGDATPPTTQVVLDPPAPAGGVYPAGTVVTARITAAAAGGKAVQRVGYEVAGAQVTAYTIRAGDEAEVTITGSGTSTLTYGAVDDQLAESAPGSTEVRIAGPAAPPGPPGPPGPADPEPRPQSIDFDQPGALTYGDPDRALVASASSGLPVRLSSLSTAVCTVAGSAVHVVGAGTCSIEAAQAGDGEWAAAPSVTRSFDVARAALTVRATDARMVRRGVVPAVAARYDGLVAGDTPYDLLAPATCRVDRSGRSTTCAGVASDDYAPAYVDGRLRVVRRGPVVVSAPLVHARAGEEVELRVRVDGQRGARLRWDGDLPAGVQAHRSPDRSRLWFSGLPEAPGLHRLRVAVHRDGREVAGQALVLRVW